MAVKSDDMEVSDAYSNDIYRSLESDKSEEMLVEDSDDQTDALHGDTSISSTELLTNFVKKNDAPIQDASQLVMSSQRNRMSIALGVLFRLVLPLCNGVARGLRGLGSLRLLQALRNMIASRQTLTNMLAYAANTISLSLSSVQVLITGSNRLKRWGSLMSQTLNCVHLYSPQADSVYRTISFNKNGVVHRIDPILKIVKLKKGSASKSIASTATERTNPSLPLPPAKPTEAEVEEYENRITMNILAEPPSDTPIRADIIFIHGLHGSLVNTWKQGLWNKNGKPVEFERPPRPPLRPPKRPRHSRSAIFTPPHTVKRRRYSEEEDHFPSFDDKDLLVFDPKTYTYECSSPNQVDFCDGVEYSFPDFQWTVEDRKNSTTVDSPTSEQSKAVATYPNGTNINGKTEPYSYCWPGDWLPIDCPGVRVIALNYTTDPYLWRPVWVRKRKRTTMAERARKMTAMLIEKRVGLGRPIIWVGHSKGGLFIKQILIDAWESGRAAVAPLWKSARGVFFYSVPHRGSPLADFSLPFLKQSLELKEIGKNCDSVLELHRRFVALYQSGILKIEVFSFVETALTLMSVLYLRIVGVDSADPGIGEVCGVHLDHREVCKPRSRNCILYTELVKMIKKILNDN